MATTPGSGSAAPAVKINTRFLRRWVDRLPVFTRVMLFLNIFLYILSKIWGGVVTGGGLLPSAVTILQAHRLNTFPVVHAHFFQALLSLTSLIPLLERFECEHGTLIALALFAGPFSTLPGILYIILDHLLLRSDDIIQGASIWVFLLLGCEAVKIYRTNPSFSIAGFQIPTWSFALVAIFILNFLIPNTSLLGHLCGAVVGYGFELGYLKFLVPPERALRWIESKLNLLGRVPHYVSVDQTTFGRYGVLPSREAGSSVSASTFFTPAQRLGP